MIKEKIKKILNSIKETDINTLIYRFDIPHEPLEEEIEALEAAIITQRSKSRNPFKLINTKLPYPLCIVEDRYCGVYSEARFLAFNMEPFSVQELPIDASDIACESFWNGEDKDYDINDYIIGKGKTPEEAVWNLILLLRDKDEI